MALSNLRTGCVFAFLALGFVVWMPSIAAGLDAENILTPLPPDFKIGFNSQSGASEMHEYVPKSETVEDWSRMITVQIVHGLAAVDPESFATQLQQRWEGACPGGQAKEAHQGNENGYPVVVWLYACPLNPETGKPENMWMKAIRGTDALYDVQYAFRRELAQDMVAPAMAYLRAVAVCDTRTTDHPCPRGMQ